MSKEIIVPKQRGQSHSCLLALEDGSIFYGQHIGAKGTSFGELVFNTSMSGYQEVMTDPSYAGQVVTFTFPEIGNYGFCDQDLESNRVYAKGIVVRHLSRSNSSWRSRGNFASFLQSQGIVGISDVDTRAITRHIRDKGAMRCAISSAILEPEQLLAQVRQSVHMQGQDLTGEVTAKETYQMGEGNINIAVLDFGIKKNILNCLVKEGFKLTIFPANTKADDILKTKPDGLFLSNGPGDPAACVAILKEVTKLIEARLPTFGICLGHQLLAIAFGASTYKLKFGHRGGNQPVKDLITGKVEITCQNHGFAVDESTLSKDLKLTHINLNDKSVEGFEHKELPVFCVQYHPEANPGPHDSRYLFGRFKRLVESYKKVTV